MNLGERMWVAGFKITGDIDLEAAEDIAAALIKTLGLSPAPGVHALSYPTGDGKGGVGFTLFQPITESFIVVDSYPELKTAYVLVSSCVGFEHAKVQQAIGELGWKIIDEFGRHLA